MSKHAPEPLAVRRCPKPGAKTDDRDWPYLIEFNDGEWMGVVAIVQGESAEVTSKRLTDCYNACAGLNPEAIPELLAAARLISTMIVAGASPEAAGGQLQRAVELSESALAKLEATE